LKEFPIICSDTPGADSPNPKMPGGALGLFGSWAAFFTTADLGVLEGERSVLISPAHTSSFVLLSS